MKLTSSNNPKIKNIIKLQKSNERKNQKLFIVEGLKEISLALNSGYKVHSIYAMDNYLKNKRIELIYEDILYEVSEDVFNKISYRGLSSSVIGIFHMQAKTISNIHLKANPIIIVLESVEKPGNLGAILRTADSAGIDAVIVCDMQTDIYNPNVIRSSRGCLFTTQLAQSNNEEVYQWLTSNKINIYSAALTDKATSYHKISFLGPTAIVFGTEDKGLSDFWLHNSHQNIIIPMKGQADSLNVSVSAAIIVYEILRQRNQLF